MSAQRYEKKTFLRTNCYQQNINSAKDAVLIGSYREFATAIFLVIEVIFLYDFDSSFAQTAPPPVLRPEGHIGVLRGRP